MNESFNIGVIGLGDRVGHLTELLLKLDPRVRLRRVVDPSPKAHALATRLDPVVRLTDDVAPLLDDVEIHHVIIGSPNRFHREHSVAALRAGKHVFCEKPLATDFEDCLAIRDAEAEAQGTFFFGLVLRYAPLYQKVRALLDAGHIGEIISVEANENLNFNHGGFIHQDWRRLRANAGTHMLEKCCHDIDVMSWMVGGSVRSVASFGGCRVFTPANRHLQDTIGPNAEGRPAFQSWPTSPNNPFNDDKDIVDHQVSILEFDNGVRAMFHTNCSAGIPERRLLILGTLGAIRADLNTGQVELRRIGWDEPTVTHRVTDENHGGADPVLVEAMSRWITQGEKPRTTIEHAMHSAAVCFAIDKALDERRVVDLAGWWDAMRANGNAAYLAGASR